jgi:LPS-assembly protein
LRYSGTYSNGWSANALFGQSYHLAGDNPFASPDLVAVGAYSGLETDTSDYVASASLSNGTGLSIGLRGRFDEKTFETRRGEAGLSFARKPFSGALRYAFIQKQPQYGYNTDRHEVTGAASINFNENWRAFSSTTYDIENKYVPKMSLGIGYDDSCTIYTVTYTESRTLSTKDDPTKSIGFFLSFRTLGDIGTSRSLDEILPE